MKTATVICAAIAVGSASAFSPMTESCRVTTNLAAKAKAEKPVKKKTIFTTIAEMDLFAPNADVNDYGSRKGKNLKNGVLSGKSYVPDGLSKAQYEKLRKSEVNKKEANYQRNVKKAGIFMDYTDFYIKRGTDTKDDWIRTVTRGHDMAKTKFDWSGSTTEVDKLPESFIAGGKKKKGRK